MIDAIRHVFEHSKQSGGALVVLLALADFADKKWEAFPSIRTLSDKSRMSERQVRRVLRDLETAQEIENTGKKFHGLVPVYRIKGGTSVTETPDTHDRGTPVTGGTPVTTKGGHGRPEGGTPTTKRGDTSVRQPTINHQEPPVEPPVEPPTPKPPEGAAMDESKSQKENQPLFKTDETTSPHSARPPSSPVAALKREIESAWNAMGAPFPQIRQWTKKRETALKGRAADAGWVTGWRDALAFVKSNDFHRGENDRGWVADLDYFLRPDTVNKMLERAGQGGASTAQPPKNWQQHYKSAYGKQPPSEWIELSDKVKQIIVRYAS